MPHGPRAVRQQARLLKVQAGLVELAAGKVGLRQIAVQTCLGSDKRGVRRLERRVEVVHGRAVPQERQYVSPPARQVVTIQEDAEHVRVAGIRTFRQ